MSGQQLLSGYGALDRALHRLAFRSGALQVALADIEDTLYRRRLDPVSTDNPVLVTALPRAGTTLLLELLNATGEFASHGYRHMPFILCPVLWRRLSAMFRSGATTRVQRAHEDGMEISLDSVESFEEVIWHQFWRDHYGADRIRPWSTCDDPEFTGFLDSHLRKIICLGDASPTGQRRYLSKNNLNIARLDCLHSAFRSPVVLVLYRDPLLHAGSLLRQHQRFLALHEESRFALEYMRGIGHFDFGGNLLPVNFGHWMEEDPDLDPGSLRFWLRYWIATYRRVLGSRSQHLHLLSFDRLLGAPVPLLQAIAEVSAIRNRDAFVSGAERIQQASSHGRNPEPPADCRGLLEQAHAIREQLDQRALY